MNNLKRDDADHQIVMSIYISVCHKQTTIRSSLLASEWHVYISKYNVCKIRKIDGDKEYINVHIFVGNNCVC